MTVHNGNKTAFPAGDLGTPGLTKREYFAAMAMQGIVSFGDNVTSYDEDVMAKAAVRIADELLAELEK